MPSSGSHNHLFLLEAEAIQIIRKAIQNFNHLALLFSGGKDSLVMLHLAKLACWPNPIPFPLLHIDTGHNFPETQDFIAKVLQQYEVKMVTGFVEETIASGKAEDQTGLGATRNALQSITLMDTIKAHQFDCIFGGGRRDEEKARAKERIFSVRNEAGKWEAENQQPELWNHYELSLEKGSHFRCFPISNWTELDVWEYIALENLDLPSLYFSHNRELIEHKGMWLANHPYTNPENTLPIFTAQVRFRTLGDISVSGAIASSAATVEDIIAELQTLRMSERGGRADDKKTEAAMEKRKKQGYF